MNETTILLSGDPKAKPDFLATVEPAIPRQLPFTLPFELVLDGYTREPWSSGKPKPNNNVSGGGDGGDQQQQKQAQDDEWQSCYLVSNDGRNRLPGFLQYLQGRKKAAIAKFEATDALPSGGPSGKSLLVVPHDPPPISSEELPEGVDKSQVMYVKYLRDERILKRGSDDAKRKMLMQQQQQQKMQQQKMQQQKMQQQKLMEEKKMQQQKQQHQKQQAQQTQTKKGATGGLLGSLLGAQRRTETHLSIVRSNKSSSDPLNFDPNAGAAGCINAFRKKISTDLEKFKNDFTTHVTKIPIALGPFLKSVPPEERDRITMDVFKFTVYETVEEIGMDKWIAHKEPSEFMDECTITIYKEGHCPPEVLEDINKGELPDEIKGQQKHLMEVQSKALQKKGKVEEGDVLRQSNREGQGVVLNKNKRDRRTMEQIQRDMMTGEDSKRSRYD